MGSQCKGLKALNNVGHFSSFLCESFVQLGLQWNLQIMDTFRPGILSVIERLSRLKV